MEVESLRSARGVFLGNNLPELHDPCLLNLIIWNWVTCFVAI